MMASSEPTTEAPKPMATKQTVSAPAESKTPPKVAEMVTQGQRKAIEGNLNGAANLFGEALGVMVETFGELDDKCLEIYRLYGSALLAIAKTEGPMGGEGGGEGGEGGAGTGAGDGDGAGAAEEDLEELSTRQLAWETLEVARHILSKRNDPESALQLAELHMELGECSLEGGLWEEAIQEFASCLDLRLKFMEPNSRLLGESHFLLAVAFHNADKFGDAAAEYKQAARIIYTNVEMLKAETDSDKKTKNVPDLEGLESMLKELKQKITDVADEQVAKAKAEKKEAGAGGSGGSAAAGGATEGVTTIGFGNNSSNGGGGGAASNPAAGVTSIGFGNSGGGGAASSGEVTTIGFGSSAKRTGQVAAVTLSSSLIKKRKTAN